MVHAMTAALTKSERWEITTDEAEQVAKGVKNVARHYGDIPGLNERTADWVALAYALGLVYGTRIVDAMADDKKPQPTTAPKPPVAMTIKPTPETQKVIIPGVDGAQEVPFQ